MRRVLLMAGLVLCVLALGGCKKAEETPAATTAATGTAAPAPDVPPAAPAVEVSAEMKDFLSMLKGKSADVTAALDKYGAEGLARQDMDMYDLVSPTVIKTETQGDKTTYTLEAKAGITVRTYALTWSGGKITAVEDKGMR
ncbi:MAG: hypothetical protein KA419_06875 [Acidobacteria bacterium]|nr:hypothetical protein [Acidobacteriota bacterium]